MESILLRQFEITGINQFPCLRIKPAMIMTKLKNRIESNLEGVLIQNIRIMGGVSSYVMNKDFPFNDLDMLYNLEFDFKKRYEVFDAVRLQICEVLLELMSEQYPEHPNFKTQCHQMILSQMSSVYFQKSISVPPSHDTNATASGDCWSLVCLRNVR